MAEQTRQHLDGGESEPKELKELIEHWVQAIDNWVQHIDQGMGGTADAAGPAIAPDPGAEADPDAPALEAG